jgi:hypothetical protein
MGPVDHDVNPGAFASGVELIGHGQGRGHWFFEHDMETASGRPRPKFGRFVVIAEDEHRL